MKRRRAAASAAIVLAASFLALDGASASSLVLDGPTRASTTSLARCGNATVVVEPSGAAAADGSYSRVRVSGVPSDCRRGTVRVARRSGAATWQQFVAVGPAATVDTGAFEIDVPGYVPPATEVGSAWVTLDGWPMPATWTYIPPPPNRCVVVDPSGNVTAQPCRVTGLRMDTPWPDPQRPPRTTNVYFTVAAPELTWNTGTVRITLDLSTVSGIPSSWDWSTTTLGGEQLTLASGTSCSSLPVVVLDGPAWVENYDVELGLSISEGSAPGSGPVCS